MPRVLLIGAGGSKDRPDHFGCHLVASVLFKALKPVRAVSVRDSKAVLDLSDIDFVVVNAEGSTHSGRNNHLYRNYGKPAALINAVWQNNPAADLSHFAYVSARESLSAKAMSDCNVAPHVVPDVMLLHEFDPPVGGGLVVSDSVNSVHAGTSVSRANLDLFLGADQLVCGRFHAACLAIAAGKPFSCYPSNTWKTEGMMKDAGLSRNYHRTQVAAVENCPSVPATEAAEYLIRARQKIRDMLEHVNDLAAAA